jgi:glycosyltransferase involved in cell wall biosynthesis
MSPVRVLYVEGNYDGTVGGSYFSLLFLLENLDRARFDWLLVLRRDTPLMPRFEAAGGRVRIIERTPPFQVPPSWRRVPLLGPLVRAFQSVVNLLRFYLTVFRLSRVVRRERVQLVHLNNSVISNYDWMLAAMLARVPCITHERGLNDAYSSMARWCAPRLARVICISQAVHDKLIERGVTRGNLVMIHNGLDPARVVPTCSAEAFRQKFGIPADHLVIGLLGNIREWKRQEIVVRALPHIVRRVPHVTCMFVGEAAANDQAYLARLRTLLEEFGLSRQVVFTGYCRQVADALNVMSVSIHASTWPEPFGRVLLEAMAMRKPVVGSRGGAVTEIVLDGVTGYTFTPSDPEDLAARVVDLLEHPERARAFGEAGYALLISDFHIASNVAKTMAVYDDVLRRRAGETRD